MKVVRAPFTNKVQIRSPIRKRISNYRIWHVSGTIHICSIFNLSKKTYAEHEDSSQCSARPKLVREVFTRRIIMEPPIYIPLSAGMCFHPNTAKGLRIYNYNHYKSSEHPMRSELPGNSIDIYFTITTSLLHYILK